MLRTFQMPLVVKNKLGFFVHDFVWYSEIQEKEDILVLKHQNDIARLDCWARKIGIRFEPVKYNMMQLTRKPVKEFNVE